MVDYKEKLSAKEKSAYAFGTLPGVIYAAFLGQIQVFYYAWMGLNVGYILIAQIIFAIWNVTNDPIFGYLQNRTRTERGRYIPWIKRFAPVIIIAFISVFMVPNEWRYAYAGEDTQFLIFIWYLITLAAYDLGFTIIYLAHSALSPQITDDFDERTNLALLSAIFGGAGMLLSQIFPLLFLTNPTAEKIVGLKIAVVIFALLTAIPYILLYKYVHERVELIPEETEPFMANLKYVFKNPACRRYMLYDGLTVGITNTLLLSITFIIAWVLGVGNPYGVQEIEFLDVIGYLVVPLIGLLIGLWLQLTIPKKKDLKTLLLLNFVFMSIGFIMSFFGALPGLNQSDNAFELAPNLWLVSVGMGIALLGFLGSMIYLNPLNGDVVDYDEFLTGSRRESVYSGVNCIISKPMYSVVLVVFPLFLSIYGLVPASPDDITSNALVVANGFHNAMIGVAVACFLFPGILSIIGFFAFLGYPLDGKKLEDIRKVLDKKHENEYKEYSEENV